MKESDYRGRPYAHEMASGSPQLAFRSFDLSVLEYYRNDPRYLYENNDVSGWICVSDEYFETDKMPESDQVLLESFGFSYDAEYNRAVAVFLRYLSHLSPEHQQIWKAKELPSNFRLHPDYYRHKVRGDWGGKVSICSAFINELHVINQMAAAMARPKFFRQDFSSGTRPTKFGFLIRPTLEEFNSFVLLLDKIISENINKKFFRKEVPYETEATRKDGRIETRAKGTLQILDDWVRKCFRTMTTLQ